MFDHISKHWEESWKYDMYQSIFGWVCDIIFSIETKTKEKMEK